VVAIRMLLVTYSLSWLYPIKAVQEINQVASEDTLA
jgi:hypothetical protein